MAGAQRRRVPSVPILIISISIIVLMVIYIPTKISNIGRIEEKDLKKFLDYLKQSFQSDYQLCSAFRALVDRPRIYIVTPTYKRPEQIPDLTRMSQTLMHVPSIFWLVVEDAEEINPLVAEVLQRSGVPHVHLSAKMPEEEKKKKKKARGVSSRNKGLEWVRENPVDPQGLVYFADDDNTYDLRLFDEIRSVKDLGMWPVGLLTSFGLSSPVVENGEITGFYDGWVANRKYPVDMAGFAVSVRLILERPDLNMPYKVGREEDGFLRQLNFTLKEIEPKARNCSEIYVWHTQTKKNKAPVPVNTTIYSTATNIWKLYTRIVM